MPMNNNNKTTIDVNGNSILIFSKGAKNNDYISLTDIAKYKNSNSSADVIKNWMRNRNTIEFLGLWEELYNPNFKVVEFDHFKNESGSNTFVLSPQKWIKSTSAIGIISTSGRYGGTIAHKDIAFEFASWVSSKFKLYLIKEYQRLKEVENNRLSLDWDVKRMLTKINYKVHTDAIQQNLISCDLPKNKISYTYANEADLLNIALFGKTAKEWKKDNPDKKGNIRDYATIEQLIIMSNIESYNADLIVRGVDQHTRLIRINEMAKNQMQSLLNSKSVKKIT